MDIKSRLKTLAILMGISNIATFVLINYSKSLIPQFLLYTPIVLTGISNVSDFVFDPADDDIVYFHGRSGDDLFGESLYALSIEKVELTSVRQAALFESGFDISPDGKYMLFVKP